MWLFNKAENIPASLNAYPFVHVTLISYLQHPYPWKPYPHFHEDEYELQFILSGESRAQLPGLTVSLPAGSVLLVPPQIAHSYPAGTQPPETLALRFQTMPGHPVFFCADGQEQLPSLATGLPLDEIRLLASLLQKQGEKRNHITTLIQLLALPLLDYARTAFHTSGQKLQIHAPQYANDILVYLQKHIYVKTTLQETARYFSLSESHLSRVFVDAYHISPINYLIYSRLRQARLLILNEHLPVPEIAKKLAYHNTHHFAMAFKQFYNCLPGLS